MAMAAARPAAAALHIHRTDIRSKELADYVPDDGDFGIIKNGADGDWFHDL